MEPGTYNLPTMTRGDHFAGVASISITEDGSPPASALSSARIHFRPSSSGHRGDPVLELSTAGGGISITSAANWSMQIPQQTLALPAGVFYYDLECTDGAGVVTTFLKGTLTVNDDVTK